MIRLFVALLIPDEIKDKIYQTLISVESSSDFRWESKEKIHLTLKFIGDVREELLPKIIEEIEFVKSFASFDCSISKFGFFFRDNEARILWCNLDTDESIISLVDELNNRLSKFGIEVERRKFKAHLTLLRIKNKVSDQFIKKFKELKINPIEFNTNKIALVRSILKQSGSEYEFLKIYELK